MNDTKDKPKTSDKTKAKAKPKPVSKKELENFVSELVMSKLGGRPSKFHYIIS